MQVPDDDRSAYRNLAETVRFNLANQQDWTGLHVHDQKDDGSPLPRILLSGLPPRRLYIHPDEQVEILHAEKALGTGRRIPQPAEFEWVLPMHLAEAPTIGLFVTIFDSIRALPPGTADIIQMNGTDDKDGEDSEKAQWKQWRGPKRGKRVLLAVVQDDSSVVYYFMHDGIVKPRQN